MYKGESPIYNGISFINRRCSCTNGPFIEENGSNSLHLQLLGAVYKGLGSYDEGHAPPAVVVDAHHELGEGGTVLRLPKSSFKGRVDFERSLKET